MDSSDDFERVLLVKPIVYVYKIPPLVSASRGFKAADWNLSEPLWTGRLRLISKGDKCYIRIEDSSTGTLYCEAPVSAYPGPQVQPVVDSRRYFVIKVVSDTGRSALIGIGFGDGADSFDLSVALQDHFTTIDKACKVEESDKLDRPKLDLSLKGDIKVKLNIGGLNNTSNQQSRQRPQRKNDNSSTDKPFVLPPPPGSKRS